MTGKGIIKGMLVTARNAVRSYFDKERMTTVQYPEQREEPEENYRNFPFLVYDGEDSEGGLRCTACKICEKECPPQCIYIVMQRDENGKPTKHPKVFDIDISVCMSCQICVEVCPFESIKMDKEYELSSRDRFGKLLLRKTDLSKSNEYYHSIRPTEAAAVDDALAEKAAKVEAKKKAAAEKKAAAAKAAAEKKKAEEKAEEKKPAEKEPAEE
jgi:NADH-quinone oxidoreductase subunit I